MKKLILLILAMSLPMFAQTSTYNQTNAVGGTVSYPVRMFSIALDGGAAIPWLEYGSNQPVGTGFSCGSSQAQNAGAAAGIGFIFIQNTALGPDSQCFNLTYADNTHVDFEGVDENGVAFTASFAFTYTTHVSGTGRYRRSYYSETNGLLTITQN